MSDAESPVVPDWPAPGTLLTEAEALALLDRAIALYGNAKAFAEARRASRTQISDLRSGRWPGAGIPRDVARALGLFSEPRYRVVKQLEVPKP